MTNKIVKAYQNGEGSIRKLAKRFKVSVNFIWTLLKQVRQTGSVAGGGRSPALTWSRLFKIIN